MPILIYHGDTDTVVPTSRSRDMAKALTEARKRQLQVRPRVPKCGHGSWGVAFSTKENWDWMFSQERK